MKIGDTFLRADSDKHLWIVLSDPAQNPQRVLLVNMTTWREWKERACILNRGDHPWITHETCINYLDAIETTLDDLFLAKDGGALKIQEPLSKEILQRILNGCLDSIHLSLEKAELLEQQGLIES